MPIRKILVPAKIISAAKPIPGPTPAPRPMAYHVRRHERAHVTGPRGGDATPDRTRATRSRLLRSVQQALAENSDVLNRNFDHIRQLENLHYSYTCRNCTTVIRNCAPNKIGCCGHVVSKSLFHSSTLTCVGRSLALLRGAYGFLAKNSHLR